MVATLLFVVGGGSDFYGTYPEGKNGPKLSIKQSIFLDFSLLVIFGWLGSMCWEYSIILPQAGAEIGAGSRETDRADTTMYVC